MSIKNLIWTRCVCIYMCVCVCVCQCVFLSMSYMNVVAQANICEFRAVPITQASFRRGSSSPLYFIAVQSVFSRSCAWANLCNRTHYNVARVSKATCNYITYVCNTSTSWWQSINLFAACSSVNFHTQCIYMFNVVAALFSAFSGQVCVRVIFNHLH